MKKKLILISLVIFVSSLFLWATISWIYGSRLQKTLDVKLTSIQNNLAQQFPNLVLVPVGYKKGIFSSHAIFEIHQRASAPSSNDKLTSGKSRTEIPLINITADILHGPFIGFFTLGFGTADIKFILLPDGKKQLPVSFFPALTAEENKTASNSAQEKQVDKDLSSLNRLNSLESLLVITDADHYTFSMGIPFVDTQYIFPLRIIANQLFLNITQQDKLSSPQWSVKAETFKMLTPDSVSQSIELASAVLTLQSENTVPTESDVNTDAKVDTKSKPTNNDQIATVISANKHLKHVLTLNALALIHPTISTEAFTLKTEIAPSKRKNMMSLIGELNAQNVSLAKVTSSITGVDKILLGDVTTQFFADNLDVEELIALHQAALSRYESSKTLQPQFPKLVYYFAQWLERKSTILANAPSFGITEFQLKNTKGEELRLNTNWRLNEKITSSPLSNSNSLSNKLLAYLLDLTQTFSLELSVQQPVLSYYLELFLNNQLLNEPSSQEESLPQHITDKHRALLFALNEMNKTQSFVRFSSVKNNNAESEQSKSTAHSFLSPNSVLNVAFKFDRQTQQVTLNEQEFDIEDFFKYLNTLGF